MQLIPNSAIAPGPAPDSALPTLTLAVSGMKCAGCVKAVETQLCNHPEVQAATVNLVTELATVECAPRANVEAIAQQLTARLTEAGFPAQLRREQGAGGDRPEDWSNQREQERRSQLRQVAIASLLLLLSAIGHLDHWGWMRIPVLSAIGFHFGLATLALAFPGRSMIVDGWRGLRRNAPNMNTLVALGTVTAYLTSTIALLLPSLGWECFFDEPVMLVGFILLGRTLEQQARHRAAAALEALIALKPSMARLIDAGDNASPLTAPATAIPASDVQVGTWLQVLPGDKMPVDGTVVAGQTTVDESMVTGESLPVLKQVGDAVVAGSLNQSGAIAIRATRVGRDTTLAQMIHLVETAQTRKAPIQKVADTVAGYFTYGVMAIAALTFLFWYGWGVQAFPSVLDSVGPNHSAMAGMTMPLDAVHSVPHPVQYGGLLLSLKLAIAVLVVACPCALGLATPTALLVGSGIGAERGLLLRGGDVLETMHHVDTVVFDKTGTLTSGHPQLTDCYALDLRWCERDLLQWAATVEHGTHHPIAQAIQQAAQQQSIPLLKAAGFVTEPGLGVAAAVEEQWVQLGTLDWLAQQHIPISAAVKAQAQALSAEGKTVVLVAIAQTVVGILGVQDSLRSDAVETVAALKQMGLQVRILSGDQPAVVEAIARAVQIPTNQVFSEMRPAQKAEAIAQLQAQGHRVLMIGDGINDAPALAQADASMAMHAGTSVAIETSDIVLMGDRLSDTVAALRLSRRTFNKIRQNLFWACIYNTLGIPAAAGVLLPGMGILLSPAVAGGLMALSSVSVVTNSLLLRRHYTDSNL